LSTYVIITPAKDEEKYIEYTLKSVCRQTLLPKQWIIVNDGSTDGTIKIVKKYIKKYSWITLINNETITEVRSEGGKIIRAFYKGFNSIVDHDYEFIIKLDADLTLPENYFEKVANAFRANPRLGICGGRLFVEKYNKYIARNGFDNYVPGAFKSYSKACFNDIGGIMPVLGWDGLDLLTAMYKGWDVEVLPLKVITHRPTHSDYNRAKLNFMLGQAAWKMGSSFILIIIRTLVRLKQRPFILAGLSYFMGYLHSLFGNDQKYVNKDLEKYINIYHYKRILKVFKLNNVKKYR